ncbi:MAG: nucleoside triphosphate pyrophosphatase [Candidatus Muiribacteriota bacterium]
MKIILASKSPRRLQILKRIGIYPQVRPADIDENISEKNPVKFACKLSEMKSENSINSLDEIVIGADTIVVFNNNILGKPSHKEEAMDFMKTLAGNWHRVITSITIRYNGKYLTDWDETRVKFSDMTEDEIKYYVEQNEWTDKAGGYGVQGKAAIFIDKIDGCYFNVKGFPARKFYKMLKSMNIEKILF